MINSIRATLLRWLSVGLLLAIGIAAGLVYLQAREEANELFDYQMQQMAASMPSQPFAPLTAARVFGLGVDDEVVIQIWDHNGLRIYRSHDSPYLPGIVRLGFSTITTPRGEWRLYSAQLGATVVQVAQPISARRQLARQMALRTVLPLALMLPLLAWLIWISVGRSLAPVRRIAGEVRARDAASLEPVGIQGLPDEIRPLAQSLNGLLLRLETALSAQRDFVADAAHELRTPLAALKLQLNLAEKAANDEERRLALADLERGVQRASHLVQQLLTLARQEPGSEQLPVLTRVDLKQIAAGALVQREAVARAGQIDLGLLETDAQFIDGDQHALQILIGNLLDNAIRHTPAGGRIDVGLQRRGGDVLLEVSDSGPGIPQQDLDRVFDRFYRAAGSVEGGSGLGLAIVQRIADRHNATVSLRNRTGGGLTVLVRFAARGDQQSPP